MTSYRNADKITYKSILLSLPNKIVLVYKLFSDYFLQLYWIEKLIFIFNYIILLYILILSQIRNFIKLFLGVLLCLVVPIFVFSIYLIINDLELYPGFEFGFLIFSSLPILFLSEISYKILKLISIIFFYFIFINIQDSNKIALEHQLNVEASKLIVNNILLEVQKQPNYNKNTIVVFTGSIKDNLNYEFVDIVPNSMMMNYANQPVGLVDQGEYFQSNIKGQIRLMGLDSKIVYRNYKEALNLPEFPKKR